MVSSNSESQGTDEIDHGMDRRTVLKGLGTGAVASVGFVGSASGHSVEEPPVFCGCSQLCVCVEGNADVLMARETDDGFDIGFIVEGGELDPYPTGEPRYSGDFCVSTDDEDVPDGQIIGLQVAGTRWVNPNQCAQAALEAEQEQLDSTHPRPEGDSGEDCEAPPCEGSGDDDDEPDEIEVTFEDCETVTVTGPDEDLEAIDIYYMRCFEDPGEGCPDGAQTTIEDPDLPLTIGRDRLAVGDEDYHIDAVDLIGDVQPDDASPPEDFDCGFDQDEDDEPDEIEVTFEDCETVSVAGPDENVEGIDIYYMLCFEPNGPCPDGTTRSVDDPEFPLTIDDRYLTVDDVPYSIALIELIGDVEQDVFEQPDEFDCSFD